MSEWVYKPQEWDGEVDKSKYRAEFEFGPDGLYALEVEVTGPCPRCHHQTTDGHPLFRPEGFNATRRDSPAYRAFLAELDGLLHAGELEELAQYRADLLCRCGEVHEGQPDRNAGCGISWSLMVTVPK